MTTTTVTASDESAAIRSLMLSAPLRVSQVDAGAGRPSLLIQSGCDAIRLDVDPALEPGRADWMLTKLTMGVFWWQRLFGAEVRNGPAPDRR
jgi:hypothetical protein